MPSPPTGRYRRALAMESWRKDERIRNRGFNHAYDSIVADGNGEDFFMDLLDEYVTADSDILDVGCGHGELTIELAKRARSAVGVERTASYVDLARELAIESGLSNVRFEVAELAGPGEDHAGGPLPLADQSIDLVVDRRGPPITRFIDDLRRVARSGTTIVGIHPAGGPQAPRWADEVGPLADAFGSLAEPVVESWVVDAARRHGIDTYRLWWIDVPEYFTTAESLYVVLHRVDSPTFDECQPALQRVLDSHSSHHGLVLRHRRLVFTVTL